MIQVILRRARDEVPQEGYNMFQWPTGDSTFVQDRWLHVVDEAGLVIACYLEDYVQVVRVIPNGTE